MKKYLRVIVGSVVGGLLGFLYYDFVGCRTGSCSLVSDPYVSTLLGIVVGAILLFPTKNRRNENVGDNEKNNN